jgi:hypothetical protein
MGEIRDAYKIVVGKLKVEEMKILKWAERNIVCWCGGQKQVVSSCEHGNKLSDSTKMRGIS